MSSKKRVAYELLYQSISCQVRGLKLRIHSQDKLDAGDLLATQNAESAVESSEVGTFEEFAPSGWSVVLAFRSPGIRQDS